MASYLRSRGRDELLYLVGTDKPRPSISTFSLSLKMVKVSCIVKIHCHTSGMALKLCGCRDTRQNPYLLRDQSGKQHTSGQVARHHGKSLYRDLSSYQWMWGDSHSIWGEPEGEAFRLQKEESCFQMSAELNGLCHGNVEHTAPYLHSFCSHKLTKHLRWYHNVDS